MKTTSSIAFREKFVPARCRSRWTARLQVVLALLSFPLFNMSGQAAPLGTTVFTYQGRLTAVGGGAPASGPFDMHFTLFKTPDGGTSTNVLTRDSVPVLNGLFTTTLDFGPDIFNGSNYWLEVGVRPAGLGEFKPLAPRQAITVAPYALYAASANNILWSGILGKPPGLDDGDDSYTAGAGLLLNGTQFQVRFGTNSDTVAPGDHVHSAEAITSGVLPSSRLGGSYFNAVAFPNPSNTFAGNGAGLTSLNASNLTLGRVPDLALSANVALLNAPNLAFSGQVGAGSFRGDGAPLTNLNAGTLTFGTLPGARLGGIYSSVLTLNNPANSFAGDGGALTGLNGANLVGTVLDARLSGNVALLDTSPTFSGTVSASGFGGSGAGLTGLNASQLMTGILPSERLMGTYSNAVTLVNPANSFAGNGSGLTTLNASSLASGTVPDSLLAPNIARTNRVWLSQGNAGTTGADYIGTTDTNALELRVNGLRALRLEPHRDGPNVIAGFSSNTVLSGIGAATIAGGSNNIINANYASISGGRDNVVLGKARYASIPGGSGARARSYGQVTYAGGSFPSGSGEAQASVYVLRGTTSGAATNELFLDGNIERMAIPVNGVWTFEVLVVAATTNNTLTAGFQAQGMVKNDGSTVSLLGNNILTATNVTGSPGNGWRVEITVPNVINAADTESALIIRAVRIPPPAAPANQIVRWVATVRTAELVHPPPPPLP